MLKFAASSYCSTSNFDRQLFSMFNLAANVENSTEQKICGTQLDLEWRLDTDSATLVFQSDENNLFTTLNTLAGWMFVKPTGQWNPNFLIIVGLLHINLLVHS